MDISNELLDDLQSFPSSPAGKPIAEPSASSMPEAEDLQSILEIITERIREAADNLE